ncbi:MAG: cation transporter [bacterium]
MAETTTTLKVQGMSCMHCVMHVKNALIEDVQGVSSADVSLEKGEATITYDPSVAELAAMADAVTEAGYTLVLPTA